MKRIVILVLLMVAVGAGYLYYRHLHARNTQANLLQLSGNVEAHESVVGFRTQGRIVELPAEEGHDVRAGELLARLDDADYTQEVRVDEAMMRTRGKELTLAQAGNRTQDVKASEQSLADAKADLELKRLDFERYSALYQRDAISAQTRDQADTAYKRAQATYDKAAQNLSLMREGTRKEQIAVSKATVHEAAQNLKLAEVRRSFTVLHAPVNGVITVRQAELGEYVVAGTPVVSIADVDHLWVRAFVPETDLGRVHWGQAVTVRTDTYPGKSYQGRISFISPQAEFTPKTVQTQKERVSLVYRIKVDVENPQRELKPGMPADLSIELSGE